MNDDQNFFILAPIYGDGSAAFRHHMISSVVFSYSNTLQNMLVYYVVTEIGWFDENLDAVPCAKKMRENGITTFLLHVFQCITFNQKLLILTVFKK